MKKLKQKISGPSKVLKTIDNIESRFGRESQPPVPEDTSAIKSCPFCDFSCRFKKSLQQHLRRKHPGAEQPVSNGVAEANDLACPHCPFKARNNQILEKHVSVKHKKAFANGSIEPEGKIASRKGLPAKPSGDSTVRTVCPDFRCPSCDFKASKFILVAQHIRKSHQKNSAAILKQLKSIKRFACPECPLKSRFKVIFLALGLGVFILRYFHLLTHAFFKALKEWDLKIENFKKGKIYITATNKF